jgi:hypothetical protein
MWKAFVEGFEEWGKKLESSGRAGKRKAFKEIVVGMRAF